jgi:enoyl-CoA hydratase/carnithine racemase
VLFTGRFFSAEEAFSWGLINKVADPGLAAETAQEYIGQILKQPLASLLATKELMRASQPDVEKAIDEELKAFKILLQTDETQRRISALLKR